jgi:Arc/MetJ-type ribon-helix-helix transcriptional regulator
MMKRPISIRLPDELREMLDQISKQEGLPVSDLVRESIRRYAAVYRFRQLRKRVLPFAEAQGLLTDDDVFESLR